MKTEEIEKLFHELKSSFQVGAIGEKQFQAEIRDLFFQDPGGHYWTIGAKTEKWYRYEDGDWVQDSPPPTLEPVEQETRPPGIEQTPPSGARSRYGNRIVFGMAGFLSLLCLVTVALVSYQLGRLSVIVSPGQAVPAATIPMSQVPATEATPSPEVDIFTPSPTEAVPVSTALPTTTPAATIPTSIPPRILTPTPGATGVPEPTATPVPTPDMKYGPPILSKPDNGALFGPGYDAILEWEPVGDLAEDEYYDVQVFWNGRSESWGQYQQGSSWTFPSFKRGAAIDEKYYWYVTVRVQVGDTRNGPADPPVSPESEIWMFLLTE